MGYIILILIAIVAGGFLFFILLPGLLGLGVGVTGSLIWTEIVNSNRKSNIDAEISLLEKLKQGNKKISLMSENNYSILLQQARSSASHPAWNLICELEKEYQSITAKYYLKEFGDGKIDRDMREAIEGKFSHTFGLSDDFHNRFNKLLSQISDTKPEIKTKEDKILFGEKLTKTKIQPTDDCRSKM